MFFEPIWNLIAPHTVLDYHKARNIHRLLEETLSRGIAGDTCECGVYRGGISILMAKVLEQDDSRQHLMFDSFEGLPHLNPKKDLPHYQAGTLACPADKIIDLAAEINLNNLEIYPGWFKSTLPKLPKERTFCLAHIDCDLYDSTVTCLEEIYPRMTPGGVMIFDDYFDACGGEKKAVDEFLIENGNELLFAGPVEQVYIYKGRKLSSHDVPHLFTRNEWLDRPLSLEHLEEDAEYSHYLSEGKIMTALPGGNLENAALLARKTLEIHRHHQDILRQLKYRSGSHPHT